MGFIFIKINMSFMHNVCMYQRQFKKLCQYIQTKKYHFLYVHCTYISLIIYRHETTHMVIEQVFKLVSVCCVNNINW